MATTPYIAGGIIILAAWAFIICICVAVAHRRRIQRSNNLAGHRGTISDAEAGRARATTRQPKTVSRDFSPVPAYHRRESYGGPAVPAAIYSGIGTADMPPAYSAPPTTTTTTTDTSGGMSSSGGNTSSSTTC